MQAKAILVKTGDTRRIVSGKKKYSGTDAQIYMNIIKKASQVSEKKDQQIGLEQLAIQRKIKLPALEFKARENEITKEFGKT